MEFVTYLLEFTRNLVVVIDNLIGPYTLAYSFYKVDGGSAIKYFYYLDLPVNFKQSVLLQKYTYWYRLTRHIIKRTCLIKVFYPYSTNFMKKNLLIDATKITPCLYTFHQNIRTVRDVYNIDIYTTSFTFSSFKLDYALKTFYTDLGSEYRRGVSMPKQTIRPFAKLHNFLIYGFKLQPTKFSTYPLVRYINAVLLNWCFEHSLAIVNLVFVFTNFVMFFIFALMLFVKIEKRLQGTAFHFQRFLKEHDQEVSSYEDIFIFVVLFLAFFINNLNIYTSSELIQYNINLIFWMLYIFFFALVFMVPLSILFTTGVNCFIYIKGTDKYNSLIAYIIFDTIAILAFFLRFFLQIIRWCLFLSTYYMLHEFVFEWSFSFLTSTFSTLITSSYTYQWLSNNILINITLAVLRFLFELFDTFLILLIQITAFIAVILWLFNYLFSASTEDVYEIRLNNSKKNYVKKQVK